MPEEQVLIECVVSAVVRCALIGVGAVLLYSAGQCSAGSPRRRPLWQPAPQLERDSGDLSQGPMFNVDRVASRGQQDSPGRQPTGDVSSRGLTCHTAV